MTKADLVEATYEKVGSSKKDVAEVIDTVFESIKEALEEGDRVKISGFGNFSIRHKRQRRGRNPQTGEEIMIGERKVMTFKASQILKDIVNKDGEQTE
ncbi:MAG: integration host factor subunit alpha [Deltaproteobacteria bacterium]|nr:integration host factor subunit alpha [Deltaproteobacteria bacterium]